jgi:hypothetical protein
LGDRQAANLLAAWQKLVSHLARTVVR